MDTWDSGERYSFVVRTPEKFNNGYYQELIAFILFLKRQTKPAFDFSLSAGRYKQCVVGRGIAEPYSKVILAFFFFLIFALSELRVFQKCGTIYWLISKNAPGDLTKIGYWVGRLALTGALVRSWGTVKWLEDS